MSKDPNFHVELEEYSPPEINEPLYPVKEPEYTKTITLIISEIVGIIFLVCIGLFCLFYLRLSCREYYREA